AEGDPDGEHPQARGEGEPDPSEDLVPPRGALRQARRRARDRRRARGRRGAPRLRSPQLLHVSNDLSDAAMQDCGVREMFALRCNPWTWMTSIAQSSITCGPTGGCRTWR